MPDNLFGSKADVRRDATGDPRKIKGDFNLPQAASHLGLDHASADVLDQVRVFLHSHAEQLRMPENATLELVRDIDTPLRRVVKYQETVQGIPVFNGNVTVHIGKDGNVKQIDLERLRAARTLAADSASADAPALTPDEALRKALHFLGDPPLRLAPALPHHVFFPADDGLHLAYEILVATREPHDWRLVMNARDGRILYQSDLIKRIDGRGLVFDPNPVVTSRNPMLRDPHATLDVCGFAGTDRAIIDSQRVSRTLRDLASTDGRFRLEGPFVRITDFGAPTSVIAQEEDPLSFNYLSSDDRFEAVNVYYHVDTIQRYIQGLGISNANNRQIACDPHDNTVNAAWYSPADKGLHFSDSGPCRPDRGEDGECILHEYGHAVQDNQVPGWGERSPATGREETGAMGEGFGDILACTFFAPEHPFQEPVFEDWIFGDLPSGGLRRLDVVKVYPTDWMSEVHADGEIWASALWEIYLAIGGALPTAADRRAARDELLKSLILSHFLVAANGTMQDGAEALLDTHAELKEHRGKHLSVMLDVFNRRGILPVGDGVNLAFENAGSNPDEGLSLPGDAMESVHLWIRRLDDGRTDHQAPVPGEDHWFCARVHNRGSEEARAFVVTFDVRPWLGSEFTYPEDFTSFISAAVGFRLAPGDTTIVRAKWPAGLGPQLNAHATVLARVYSPFEQIPPGTTVGASKHLAQRGLMAEVMA